MQDEDLEFEKTEQSNKKKNNSQAIKEEASFEVGLNENGKKIIKTAAKQPNKGIQIV